MDYFFFLFYKLKKASVNHHIDTKNERPCIQYSFLGPYSLCVRKIMTDFIVYFILYIF